MLIIVALFVKLRNLKQLIYEKIMCLKIVGVHKKYCLNFQPTQDSFLLLFCFSINKMVDSEYGRT